MFVNNSTFDNAMYLLNKGLNAESLRFNVLNNNVVNANTPNFKRSDVTFEGELQRAMNSEEEFKDMTMYPEMMIKNPAISFIDKVDISDVEPNITTDFLSSYNNNNNNVNIQSEMVKTAKSKMKYEAMSSFIGRIFKKIGYIATR